MTDKTNSQNTPAPQEIDPAALDQVVGAGVVVHEARQNEQNDKLRMEESQKRSIA
ncbi:hypothetical protein [Sandarakinorhabdus sp.]|uniref:hypothetical protein n=1 Tax=Sandarakinorhabdus sp. TaxID=1916663 RepID=UPI00333F8839